MDFQNRVFLLFILSLCVNAMVRTMDRALSPADKVFLNACKNNKLNSALIDLLSSQQCNFNVTEPDPENKFTGRDYLCTHKNFDVLQKMIAKKIYTVDSIFFSACELDVLDEEFINFILSQNGDINVIDSNNGYTGLHYACFMGALRSYMILREKEAQISVDNDGNSLLHTACAGGTSAAIVWSLLESKDFNLDEKDKYGRTPLHYACVNATLEIVDMLLEEGAQQLADEEGKTPLHMIGDRDNKNEDDEKSLMGIIEKLIAHDSSVINKKDNNGRTVLHVACEFLSPEVVEMFLDAGAQQVRDKNGESPLDCSQYNEIYDEKVIQYILKAQIKSQETIKNSHKNNLKDVTNTSQQQINKPKKHTQQTTASKKKKKSKKKTQVIDVENKEPQEITSKKEKIDTIEKTVRVDNNEHLVSIKEEKMVTQALQDRTAIVVTKYTYAEVVHSTVQDAQILQSQEKNITFHDPRSHLTISACVPMKNSHQLIDQSVVNNNELLCITDNNCSQHVIDKKNNPRDVLHNFSSEVNKQFGPYATVEKNGTSTLYNLPVNITLPAGKSMPATLEWIMRNGRNVHRFIRPIKQKKDKSGPLLLQPFS